MFPAHAIDTAVDASVATYRLRELARDGSTLVRESGVAPGLRLRLEQTLAGAWAAHAALGGWATRADYAGRTQSGTPATSHTDAQALVVEAGLAWRPTDGAWRIDGALQVERFRRHIVGTAGAAGLDERLTQPRLLLGAGWSDPVWSLDAGLVWGPRAPLDVRFDEGLFDPVTLRSGRARGATLQARHALAARWRIGVDAEWLDVERSLDAALTRGGIVVGTVAQPHWRRERIALVLQRALD
ncbi:MAG TPA: hypothetical protein VFZ28_07030 [Burkholderiaceae bacterium]|nr:hypothetical protein [Burkholderiaceae bacterium]